MDKEAPSCETYWLSVALRFDSFAKPGFCRHPGQKYIRLMW